MPSAAIIPADSDTVSRSRTVAGFLEAALPLQLGIPYQRSRVQQNLMQGGLYETPVEGSRGRNPAQLSVKTTWKMVYLRKFGVVHIGRSVRITAESIDELIDDGTIPADRDHDGDDDREDE